VSEQENASQVVEASAPAVAPEPENIGQNTVNELFGDGVETAKKESVEAVPAAAEQKKEPVKEPTAEKSTSNNAGSEKHKPSRYEQNIGKMTRINGDLTRENAKLKERIAELEKLQSSAPDTAGMTDRQAAVVEATHAMEVKRAQERVTESEQSLVSHQNQYYEQLVASQIPEAEMEAFMADYGRYSQAIAEHEPEIAQAFKESSFGPLILREFFNDVLKNEANLMVWARLNPYDKRLVISQMVTNLQRGNANAPAQQQPNQQPTAANVQLRSSAPAPIAPSNKANIPSIGIGDETVRRLYGSGA